MTAPVCPCGRILPHPAGRVFPQCPWWIRLLNWWRVTVNGNEESK